MLLLDVSGSMSGYSRALLVFAHATLRADRRWEAFCFGTRLTRVTPALAEVRPDEALRRVAGEVFDWEGGTRIGDCLERFLDDFGHRGLARGAVVLICPDGLEVGDPERVREQMARLSRLAHRVVWLNPLQEDPAYEPLARGMQAVTTSPASRLLPRRWRGRSGSVVSTEIAAAFGAMPPVPPEVASRRRACG